MHKSIDADYYGFRDEEDGVLLREEAEATKLCGNVRTNRRARARRLADGGGGADGDAGASGSDRAFVAHVPLPEKEQIEALVLEKKKKICSRSTPGGAAGAARRGEGDAQQTRVV